MEAQFSLGLVQLSYHVSNNSTLPFSWQKGFWVKKKKGGPREGHICRGGLKSDARSKIIPYFFSVFHYFPLYQQIHQSITSLTGWTNKQLLDAQRAKIIPRPNPKWWQLATSEEWKSFIWAALYAARLTSAWARGTHWKARNIPPLSTTGKRNYLEREKSELGLEKRNWFLNNSWCATPRGSWTEKRIYSTACDSWDMLKSPQLSQCLLSTAYTFFQKQGARVSCYTANSRDHLLLGFLKGNFNQNKGLGFRSRQSMHPKLHSTDRFLQWRTCLVVQDPFPLCSPTQQLERSFVFNDSWDFRLSGQAEQASWFSWEQQVAWGIQESSEIPHPQIFSFSFRQKLWICSLAKY